MAFTQRSTDDLVLLLLCSFGHLPSFLRTAYDKAMDAELARRLESIENRLSKLEDGVRNSEGDIGKTLTIVEGLYGSIREVRKNPVLVLQDG